MDIITNHLPTERHLRLSVWIEISPIWIEGVVAKEVCGEPGGGRQPTDEAALKMQASRMEQSHLASSIHVSSRLG